jgi:hypothetical protein
VQTITVDNIQPSHNRHKKDERSKSSIAVDEHKTIMGGSEIAMCKNESANSSSHYCAEEGVRSETNDSQHPPNNNDEAASPTSSSAPVVIDTTTTTTTTSAVTALTANASNNNFLDLEAGRRMAIMEEEEEEEKEDGFLILPHLGPRYLPSSSLVAAEVHNLCAICLESYSPGDSVVWSSNPKCCHVFHTDCMVHYLVHVKNGGTSCPTCRQTFTVLGVLEDESAKNGAEC